MSDWEEEEEEGMHATEIEGSVVEVPDPISPSASGNPLATTLTMSSLDMERNVESSQQEVGRYLLEASEDRWERKATALLEHDRRLAQLDDRIETRARETDRRIDELVNQANAPAESAAQVLSQVRGANQDSVGGSVSRATGLWEQQQPPIGLESSHDGSSRCFGVRAAVHAGGLQRVRLDHRRDVARSVAIRSLDPRLGTIVQFSCGPVPGRAAVRGGRRRLDGGVEEYQRVGRRRFRALT